MRQLFNFLSDGNQELIEKLCKAKLLNIYKLLTYVCISGDYNMLVLKKNLLRNF